MDIIQAIVYGVLQGLTEFLPISSTAHIRIAPTLFHWPDPGAAFTAAIQLGTLLAIVIYFWRDLRNAIQGWGIGILNKECRNTIEYRMGWAVCIGTIPIVVLGYFGKEVIERDLRSLYVVAISLITFGFLMGLADRFRNKSRSTTDVEVKDGAWVGMWQAIALIPGCSRSGSTITGALFAGFDRAAAARFSFLLSVPSILLAGIYSLVSHRNELLENGLTNVIVANVVSFGFGYLSIAYLMRYLQTKSLLPFVVYRVVLGGTILILLATSVLKPL